MSPVAGKTRTAGSVPSYSWACGVLTGVMCGRYGGRGAPVLSEAAANVGPRIAERVGRPGTVNEDERAPFVRALQRARVSAYAPGEFVEQESFMRATEIRALARRAGIGPGLGARPLLRRRRSRTVRYP